MKKIIFLLTLTMILFCTVTNGTETCMTKLDLLKYRVGYCESRNGHEGKWGDNGLAYGRYQFHQKTFNWLKNKYGRPELQRTSLADQEWLFEQAIKDGRGNLWSCYKKECKVRRRGITGGVT